MVSENIFWKILVLPTIIVTGLFSERFS
jgi:hypothetical protein